MHSVDGFTDDIRFYAYWMISELALSPVCGSCRPISEEQAVKILDDQGDRDINECHDIRWHILDQSFPQVRASAVAIFAALTEDWGRHHQTHL